MSSKVTKVILDKILVKKTLAGSEQAFVKLFKHYKDRVYSIAYRIMKNEVEAEDVVQDTFISAYRNLSKFKFKAQFYTWLYRIAVNKCYERLRKKKNKKEYSIDDDIQTETGPLKPQISDNWANDPSITLENDELRSVLNNAISSLPEKYRTVLTLKEIDNLKNKEIGKILGITLPAVKARLHRARLKVQKKINSFYRGEKPF